MAKNKQLTSRSEDFSAWYNEIIFRAELADHSPVKGSMVIRPWGYAIWENMQRALDDMFKQTGHQNVYLPLLIPMSFIEKEKDHVEGFKPELVVVTHAGGKELEEALVVRPTSETVVMSMMGKWIQSYRDLPMKLNQWANVMRWELRTRLFLRTSEFLWQEGHTMHANSEEAEEHTQTMLGVYRCFMEDWMAMPPVTGLKSESEKFAGAIKSYSCEAMMQDNKALQAGTSHFLGQNFSRQFDVRFQSAKGKEEYGWNTSWGVSTRLIGGLIMTHGDDMGLILPPKIAPTQVIVIPVKDMENGSVLEKANSICSELKSQGIRAEVDDRDFINPGSKFYEWERKGVPIRLEIGPRDLESSQVVLVQRIGGKKEIIPQAEAVATMPSRLEQFQDLLLEMAMTRREDNSHRGVTEIGEIKEIMEQSGGFVYTGWSGDPEVEQNIKELTGATLRCLPSEEFQSAKIPTDCIGGKEKSEMEVVWAKAY
ncbi:MAG: proline--tRNA ligase [Gemmatimonadetes bacterium]|jgi:prolyl-tRNA synthetase|nr:proline--tRNA ligase [Gemmatimonadota bacterium]|tara:strand:- start:1775 stop:3220 length:1446 start_codon:yes stop_codon:yes gene_type:complete